MTSARIAEALGIGRACLAQIKKRSDLMLSTLRGYLEAMGASCVCR